MKSNIFGAVLLCVAVYLYAHDFPSDCSDFESNICCGPQVMTMCSDDKEGNKGKPIIPLKACYDCANEEDIKCCLMGSLVAVDIVLRCSVGV